MINLNEKIKYRIYWLIGSILSFILYFSGIVAFYEWFRKEILKKYRNIVLTYHRIGDFSQDQDISISIEKFDKQMAYLKNHFNVFSLDTFIENIEKNIDIQRDMMVITFDDGYKDNYLNAYPILKKFQLPGTIFLITNQISKGKDKITVDDIKIMKSNGISFGSHTVNHRVLSEIDAEEVTAEVFQSKVELENLLDEKIKFIAYPKGKKKHFNHYVKAQVRKSGYKAAFTTENGVIDSKSDFFELKRIGVRNCPLFVFKTRVSGIFESRLVCFARNLLGLT